MGHLFLYDEVEWTLMTTDDVGEKEIGQLFESALELLDLSHPGKEKLAD